MELTKKHCVPCEGGVEAFTEPTIERHLPQLQSIWTVLEHKKLHQIFIFKDFKEAMKFVDKVASIAEDENHHPDFIINYNKVIIELTTHAIGGLSENDFIMAAKIEEAEHAMRG